MKLTYLVLVGLATSAETAHSWQDRPIQASADITSNGVLELRVEQMKASLQDRSYSNKLAANETQMWCPILITLKNISLEPVEFMTTIPELDFRLEVLEESGKKVPMTEAGHLLSGPADDTWILSRRLRKLMPGEHYATVLHLALYYQINPGANYSLKVMRTVTKRDLSGKIVESKLIKSLTTMPRLEK